MRRQRGSSRAVDEQIFSLNDPELHRLLGWAMVRVAVFDGALRSSVSELADRPYADYAAVGFKQLVEDFRSSGLNAVRTIDDFRAQHPEAEIVQLADSLLAVIADRNLLVHGLWTYGDQSGRPVEIRHRPPRNGEPREIVLRYDFLNEFPERINRLGTAICKIANDAMRIRRAMRMAEQGLSDS